MQQLSTEFENISGHQVRLSAGSSGKQYAQIMHGAPYDVFLSADSERPKRLIENKIAVDGSRVTYAIGRLVLWGRDAVLLGQGAKMLGDSSISRFAIANPRLAPYGAAAKEVLVSLNRYDELKPKIVKGENINQTYQFVATGNAQVGVVSYAQIKQAGHSDFWLVPSELHLRIEQQLVIINDSKGVRELFRFLQSSQAKEIIQQHGYDIP